MKHTLTETKYFMFLTSDIYYTVNVVYPCNL